MVSKNFITHHGNRGPRPPRRAGFTLVEMLVVIMLLLLVTLMTIGAVNSTLEQDRARDAARQVQSYIEGAKSRAAMAKQNRGVRLILDSARDVSNRRHMVRSLTYIQPMDDWSEGQIILMRPVDGSGNVTSTDVTLVRGDAATSWYALAQRGLIRHLQTRIRIPADDGATYVVSTAMLGPAANQQILVLTTPYRGSGLTASTQPVGVSPTPESYALEMPWVPPPNTEPIQLPGNAVIDLDLSELPSSWRDAAGTDWRQELDLQFSPIGTVIGDAAGKGIIHFWVWRQEDADLLTLTFPKPDPAYRLPLDPDAGNVAIVSLRAGTGTTGSHPLDMTDANSDMIPDDPYRLAERGAVAGR